MHKQSCLSNNILKVSQIHLTMSHWSLLTQVPIVIRGPGGVGRQLGAEHSQRLESYFQSIPGVQLVACSTVANAKALLKSAIRSDNPVIFFEHVLLYNVKGECIHGAEGPYPYRSTRLTCRISFQCETTELRL